MRIGVNAVPLRASGGGARYAFTGLLERLLAQDHDNDYVFFTHPLGMGVVSQVPGVHAHLPGASRRRHRVVEVICEEELFSHRDEFDLFFGPLNNLQPRMYDRPSVAILHDIQEHFFPEFFSESDLRGRQEIYPEICRSATLLVTISEFCKRTIVERFDIDPGKVRVIYNAPQAALVARDPADDGNWRRDCLPERFFFYPANCYLHKNHAMLLDALSHLRSRGSAPFVVFCGYELPGGFPLRAEITKRGLDDVCRVFEEVDIDELRHLYRRACALVMPTLFEGFGMPVVEGMACGCPVICSDLPPLREIAGDRALYFAPGDVSRLVEHLETVIQDQTLRARLAAEGPPAAQRFSWDRAAEQVKETFAEAARRFYSIDAPSQEPPRAARSAGAPRIGVLITGARDPGNVQDAIRHCWKSGYPQLKLRALLPADDAYDGVRRFLDDVGIPHESATDPNESWRRIRQFAEEQRLDLVAESHAGRNRFLPTAFHSVAWGYRTRPDQVCYLGEAWEARDGRVTRVARLRRLANGDWKLEEYLYPEMVFVAPHALDLWDHGRNLVEEAGADWRWVLVRECHRAGRLCLLRRSLALCDPAWLPLSDRYRAARQASDLAHTGNGHPPARLWLRGLKPILRPVGRMLPGSLREKGKRIWRHLAQEP